jgi:hypothetical protein
LREGVLNFFAVFIEVLQDRAGTHLEWNPESPAAITSTVFLLGTREALYEKGRQSITLTVRDTSPFSIGMLIALFERTVGFYARSLGSTPTISRGWKREKRPPARLSRCRVVCALIWLRIRRNRSLRRNLRPA